METGLRLGSHMFCRCHRHQYPIVENCKTIKSRPILNFARLDSLVCIVASSREKSRSLSLALFLARCHLLLPTCLMHTSQSNIVCLSLVTDKKPVHLMDNYCCNYYSQMQSCDTLILMCYVVMCAVYKPVVVVCYMCTF